MKAHLLYQDRDFDFKGSLPPNQADLVQDLELRLLLEAMAQGDEFLLDVATKVLLNGSDQPQVIRYRQHILQDGIAHPEIIRELYGIAVAALDDKRKLWGYHSPFPTAVLTGAVSQLEASFARLKQLRKVADDHGNVFHSEGLRQLFDALQQELDDAYRESVARHLQNLRLRNGPTISMELDRDNTGINFVLRTERHPQAGWKERLGIGPRSVYSFSVPPNDEGGHRTLSDLVHRGINLVANAAAQSADHILSFFSRLREELGFYIGGLNLWDQITDTKSWMRFPEPEPSDPLQFTTQELCDACLILTKGQSVVGNSVDGDGKSLIVITGANSGGKSTFLRSVGVAQLMMQSGLFVTAKSFRASVSCTLFTHFSREEDASMTTGRLDEELKRMSTIADQIRTPSLVLFNESFSSTNEREGSEIGHQVIKSLLDANVKVMVVTHQFDLADGFFQEGRDAHLFLRAARGADGQRRYRLGVGQPLPTSFGEDLYYRVGRWMNEQTGE